MAMKSYGEHGAIEVEGKSHWFARWYTPAADYDPHRNYEVHDGLGGITTTMGYDVHEVTGIMEAGELELAKVKAKETYLTLKAEHEVGGE